MYLVKKGSLSRDQASEAVEHLERRLGEKGVWVKYKTPREIAEES
jgi:polyhydroxyalkanoate synthesis regulator phasin